MGDQPVIRVVIVDDHVMVRQALHAVLEGYGDLEVVGVAGDADEAVAVITATDPDVTLLDLRLGARSGTEVARAVRARHHAGRVVVLSAHQTAADLREALAAGADGYLVKTADIASLTDGIRRAHAGETVVAEELVDALVVRVREDPTMIGLTPRELQVLEQVVGERTPAVVAENLGMGVRTVHKHLERLYRKLGVHDRRALAARAVALGFVGQHRGDTVDGSPPRQT